MTQTGFCFNHPGAGAIAVCINCGKSLCGMCSRFSDDGVRCERCADVHETEQLVRAHTERLNKPATPIVQEVSTADAAMSTTNATVALRWVQWTFIVVLLGGIATSMYFYANPRIVVPESPTRAREEAVTALVKCLQVFRQIGEQMATGQAPDMSLQCAPPAGPNRLQREGDTVRISHPNPSLYGLQTIYVTNTDPEPLAE